MPKFWPPFANAGFTLVDLLRARAQERSDIQAYTFLDDGEVEGGRLNYRELDLRARAIGARLQAADAAGERVLLLFPPGLDFIAAFFGCLYAGAVAIPAYPPRAARTQPRLRSIAGDARPAFVLAAAALVARAETLTAQVPELQGATWLATESAAGEDAAAERWTQPAIGPDTLAFLQYTSGSTASPKGVMVSHRNLLQNEEMIRVAFGQSEDSVVVGWLPLYHDMGLIGNVLQPLYVGGRCVLMSPMAFLQRPLRWLEAISRYGGTTSGGPNFAYDLCVRRLPPHGVEGLDLSRWTLAYNGSEPVRAETMERFAAAFAPYGFDRRAFFPCYGLAEATLFVTGGSRGTGPVVRSVAAAALEQGRAIATSEGGDGQRSLVACGRPGADTSVLIVDPSSGEPCPPDGVGEIWVAGPSVARGYWNLPEVTGATFQAWSGGQGPYLRTGDLGFQHAGELFVTGRLKDLIILRGRNLYPQDLELTAERSHPSLRMGCGAAFSVDAGAEERLVLVHELERGFTGSQAAVAAAIRRSLAEEHEVQVHEIVFLPQGALPKTSSGKIQRQACRQLHLAGELPAVGRSLAGEEPGAAPSTVASLPTGWRDLPAPDRQDLLEEHLIARLAAVLRLPAGRIDRDQPLTSLGLDSLAAVELQGALEADAGVPVDLAELLQGPTLRELASLVLRRTAADAPSFREEPPLTAGAGGAGAFPLSYGQRALWFLQTLQASSAYNIAAAARVGPGLSAGVLRRAFELLAGRHDALRLSFAETSSGPVQEVVADRAPEVLEEDAADWSEERLSGWLQETAARPFDLARDPLLRVALLATAEGGHVVLLVIHHIVADLWSLAVLVRDLERLVPRLAAGGEVTLEAPVLRYADYVDWQRRLLEGASGERLWAYWRGQLQGELPVISLPADHARPPLQTFRGDSCSRWLAPELLERLRALGREQGATLYAVVLSAFAALLHRYSGQTELLVGSPTAGRGPAGLAEVVGYFVNPVVLRVDLTGRPAVRDLVTRVRDTTLEAFRHQDFPFPLLVERLQPERDPSRSPLFQVMLTLQRSPVGESGDLAAFALGEPGAILDLAGLEVESYPLRHRAAQLDLELMVAATARGLGLVLIHNADLFEPSTAERLLAHLEVLIAGAAAAPGRLLSELPLLTAAEREQLLVTWNSTATQLPLDRCLPSLFAEQAELAPDAPAAVYEGRTLTYRELRLRSLHLARRLRPALPGPEALVAVWAERSLDFLTAMLGIFEAGGVYLPLDARQPERRLAQTLGQSGTAVVLVSRPFLESCGAVLGEDGPTVLVLEDLLAAANREEGEVLPGPFPEQLAYVLYTSGSTGVPKGAMLTHRGMLNHLFAKALDLRLTAGDRVAQTAAPTFDISVWQFLASLLVGGCIEILPDEVATDPARLLVEVERRRITILETVPSLMRAVLQEAASGARPDLPALRWLIPTGEALPPDLARQWYDQYPAVPLLNAYGPTECSDDVTHHVLRCPLPGNATTTPIGRPVANLRIHVLDQDFHLVPVSVPGELCVAGAGVGRGYLGDPARTAPVFVPDPLAPDPGGRLYRTGDLGRRSLGGELEFLGRLDHQVKVRGFRIEMGEIEAVLAGHGAVAQAVVVALRAPQGEDRLVAYWTGETVQDRELREFLRQRLPEAMVPAAFVQLEAFPLLRNGKVDRKALPQPDWTAPERGDAAPFRDELEELLAGIVAAVLGRNRVGATENFFEAGGHSLLATQVISRVRQTFGLELPLADFFAAPTLAGLAARVRAARGLADLAAMDPPRPTSRDGALPLSFGQQRLWFLDRLEPGNPVYNMPGQVRFRGLLRPEILRQALRLVVDRQESLRTVFQEVGGTPAEVILTDPGEVALPLVDLRGLPDTVREACAGLLASEEARRPFDLACWPLFRAHLLRLGEGEHVLLFNLHHIVSDGWSQGILVRELSEIYRHFSGGTTPALPELPVQYADYARWQLARLEGEELAGQLAWWREQLAGSEPALALPTDRPRPLVQTYRGTRRPIHLGRELAEELRRTSRSEGVTVFMALFALYAALLHRWSGQARFNVGTPIANRRWSEVEGLIGFFVNTLVLPCDFEADPSFSTLLGRIRTSALGAYAHQDLPFERLVDEVQPERDLSRNPLFQVLFVLQNAPVGRLDLPGLESAVTDLSNGTAKFELHLSLEEVEDGLTGWIEYSTDLFDGPTIARFAAHLPLLLKAVLEQPGRPLSDLPLLSPEERQALLEWNSSAEALLGAGLCLHELVGRQAERTPGAVAVTFGEKALTYAELDAQANRLAHLLRQRGVAPEVPVGVCLERSLELIVALLGVLKAGGCYLPLDPSYPRERLAQILEDALAEVRDPVLLTQRSLAGLLPAGSRALCLDAESTLDLLSTARSTRPPSLAGPDHLAYVIFTSGSTGRPKGAMNTHRGVVNRLLWGQHAFGLSAADRVLQKTPFSFDVSAWEIFWPLLAGACLVVARPDGHRDGAYLARTIAGEGVTLTQFVPSMIPTFLEAPGVEHCRSLRRVICSGEALPQALVDRFHDRLPWVEVHNLYGPTEAAIEVTSWRCEPAGARPSAPIGRPVANTAIHLLDRHLRQTPMGVPGELYIAGVQVGRGYQGRPALTAERFVPDPFALPGCRMYRTGDLARHLPGGEIEFLGRLDHQVKIRGLRIELGEIEAALRDQAAVRDAVVVVQDVAADRRIVAYVVPEAASPPGLSEELRGALAVRLPEYMVPSAWVFLAGLPLTTSGKVDRAALPAPEWSSQRAFVPPRNPVEEVLAGVFASLLPAERVGVEDDFFALGGHSLLATRLVSRIREALGVELPVRAVFAAPTVAGLAKAVEEATGTTLPPIERLPPGGALPQSFSQARLWFLYQLAPRSVAYNIPVALRFEGSLDLPALAASLSEIVRRHEVLRSTYATQGGEPVQRVSAAFPLPLPVVDLASLPRELRSQEEQRWVREEARTPFDIAQGPVVRTTLLATGRDEHVLLMTVHHIAADGWSMGVVVREMEALYPACASGRPAAAVLPELPVQFADFAAWQRDWLLGSGQMDLQLAYWRERLRGAPPFLDLATDRPRPQVQSYAGARRAFSFSPEVTRALQGLSRTEGATPFMVLLAAFQLLLSRHSRQADIVVGAPVANRRRVELESLIGFFANTLALRTDLERIGASGEPTFRALLAQVRDTTLGAFMNQDLPFERLVEELQPERRLSHSPIFQVLFVLQNTPYRRQLYTLPGLTLSVLESEDQGSQFDLTLALEEHGDQLLASFYYSTELFDASTIDRLWHEYQASMEALLAHPEMPLPELPRFGAAERRELSADIPAPPSRERVRTLQREGLLPSTGELREFLLARLPEYMIPSSFIFLDDLPLTYSGKRDLRNLPEPGGASEQEEVFVAPRTPLEEGLATIVAALVKRERVGVETNFFEMGGHSLLVMQLVGQVQEAFGIELSLQNVFETPTVAGLASTLEARQTGLAAEEEGARGPALTRVSRQEPLALSFSQQRLWFIDQLEPCSPLYNIPLAVRFSGSLRVPVMIASLQEIVRRHETLRTVFPSEAGQPRQVILPQAAIALPVIDLSMVPEARREQQAVRLAAEEAVRPFNLTCGPLVRMALLRLRADEHVGLLNLHHIISDQWSMTVFVRELCALYGAVIEGRPSPLPELPVQYADFAAWQRRWLAGANLEHQLAYWRSALAGAPQTLELPTDRPRPAIPSARGGLRLTRLPMGAVRELQEIARREGATTFMAMLAVAAALLSRLTGKQNLLLGTPVANRGRAEIQGLIGFFLNTLVLRMDLSGRPCLRDLLRRAREVSLAAFSHQDFPFEQLVEEVVTDRHLSQPPLVQVLLVVQKPEPAASMPGLTMRRYETGTGTGTSKFDLTLFVEEEESEVTALLEYSQDLFDSPTVERFLGHFGALLEGLTGAPDLPLERLSLLTEPERQALLVEWNDTASTNWKLDLIAPIEAQAARAPEAVAVVWGAQALTYAGLNARANRLAHHLQSLGVGAGVAVALLLARSIEMIVGVLAVLKAGGAYVPLDPAYPAERLSFMLADSRSRVLLTQRFLDVTVPVPAGCTVLDLDCDGVQWQEESSGDPSRRVDGDDLAYLIYTSGSTGLPKGVAMTHRALSNLIEWQESDPALCRPARTLQFSSLSFDVSFQEIVATLRRGGTLYLISEETRRDPQSLLAVLRQQAVERLYLPFVALRQLAETAQQLGEEAAGLELREVLTAGEQLQVVPAMTSFFSALPQCRLYNYYGPSETHVITGMALLGHPEGWPGLPPIGRPVANTAIYLVDPQGEPVPLGVPGELWVGGVSLARGYLERPDRTAERFVPDPWSGDPGARLYRTGDLTRYRADGEIEFLGRIDNQVKVRGYRIELGEIETALAEHSAVRAAVVVVHETGPSRDKRLFACASIKEGHELRATDLRGFLRERLPEYMVPSSFILLPAEEKLPLTPSGKVDRQALTRRVVAQAGVGAEAAGKKRPATPLEELLAGIFASVLNLKQVGADDNFFELGGHSLLATQVASRVRSLLEVELPVRCVFEAPTVEGLAGWLEVALRGEGRGRAPAPIVRVSRQEPSELSFAQQRLWFLDQLEPGSAAYNIPAAVELTGRLDRGALEAAFGEVVRRHEVLRTTFRTVAGEPVQVWTEHAGLSLPSIDLQGLPGRVRREEASRLAEREARRPFDLGRGPLLRVMLVELSATEHVALVMMHHIVSDGWSMGLLVREIGALYAAFVAGRPSPLSDLAIQYADFAVWQRQHLSGEFLESELAWWREQLAGVPQALDLPADHPRPAARSVRGAVHRFLITSHDGTVLTELSRQHGATLFMTLLSGFVALLHRYTGGEDLVVGTPIAGRNREETEPLIGFFVNTLALRIQLRGAFDFVELLRQVRETTLLAYTHQDVPFERLVEELAPQRDLSRPPLVQVLLTLQNAPAAPLELPGLALVLSPVTTRTAKLDLECTFVETESGLAGVLEYSRDLFEAPTIARLAGHFSRLLAEAAADPRRCISELPLLSEAEWTQLVVEWNDTEAVYPRGLCLHELVAAQAERTPEALAVSYEGESLTYRQLVSRARRLAWHLLDHGVEPGGRVGVLLERSLEMIVGLLGVLEAGAAYVPLDPDLPAERIGVLVQGAGLSVIVAQEKHRALIPEQGTRTVLLDTHWPRMAELPASPPAVPVGEGDLAYVLFTSGSTGTPKGVMISHQGIVNRLLWMQEAYGLTAEDRVLQKTPFSFDVSLWEFFWPLLTGARLVFAQPGGHQDPQYLASLIARERITTLHFVPSMLQTFLEAPGLEALTSLRLVMASGEALQAELVRLFFARLGHAELHNLYGPTEASVDVSFWRCSAAPPRSLVPIGRPIANHRLLVVDRSLGAQPIGAPGELLLGGPGLAQGYLGRPDLTAAAFIPDPFGREPGSRLYRTGDLVRHLPDGNVQFLGRIDHQVKIRGLRVELGEIEAALREHPAVHEAVAVVREIGPGDRRLVAYAVPEREPGPTLAAEIRAALGHRLPEYMIPSALMFLTEFPLTSNGKLDRAALPAPEWTSERRFVSPSTPVQEVLAQAFCSLLHVERVGAEDDFFALGGHSLLAMQLVSRLRDALAVELPMRTVFAHPTVSGLARAVEREAGTALPPIRRGDRGGAALQSYSQARLWFLHQLAPQGSAYNIDMAVHFEGPLDVRVLAASLSEIVRRHEVLRSTFATTDGDPIQRVQEAAPVPLPCVDLTALPAGSRRGVERRLMSEEAHRPFDIGRGPVIRATLLRHAAEEFLLLVTIHHIAADGWSLGVVARELEILYPAFASGAPSPLPELSIQFADFAVWQRRWLAEGGHLESQLAYWAEQLHGAPPLLELATDRPRPAVQSFSGARGDFSLPVQAAQAIQALGRAEGATLSMILLAAFSVVLSRHSGQTDIVVGSPIANRRLAELEPLVGFFANTVALRTNLEQIHPPTFRELLAHVREVSLGAYMHQDLPFEKLVEELQPERRLDRSPIFQVLYVVHNTPYRQRNYALPDVAVSVYGSEDPGAQFDITLAVEGDEERLTATIYYSTDLFDATTISRFWQHFEAFLLGALAEPERPIPGLPLCSEAERHAMLVEWSDPVRQLSSLEPALVGGGTDDRIFILSRDGQPVPIGVPGEIHLGTAPFEMLADLRPTGRRAVYRRDGRLESLPDINPAAPAREQVRALLAEGLLPPVRALREFLLARLPEYMVPSDFVYLDSIPLTYSGKRDLRALPEPDALDQDRETFVAPRTPTEETLAEIVAILLKREQVSVEANLFEMGGHSLLVMQLVGRIQESFGIELTLQNVFETPTVAGLAGTLDTWLWARLESSVPMVGIDPEVEELEL